MFVNGYLDPLEIERFLEKSFGRRGCAVDLVIADRTRFKGIWIVGGKGASVASMAIEVVGSFRSRSLLPRHITTLLNVVPGRLPPVWLVRHLTLRLKLLPIMSSVSVEFVFQLLQ